MQQEVYADSVVQSKLMEYFEVLRLNAEDKSNMQVYNGQTFSPAELATRLGAQGFPTTVFLEADGTPIATLPGFVDADMFLSVLRYIYSESYRTQTFREFMESK